MPVVVVGAGNSVVEALSGIRGVRVTAVGPDQAEAVLGESPVLVTFVWQDAFLTPALRWVQAMSGGVEQFPAIALREAGIVLTSARGIHGDQVSEHAFGLLLGLTRGIATSVRRQLHHEWRWPRVAELGGLTMGVLGLGTIGEAIARRPSPSACG